MTDPIAWCRVRARSSARILRAFWAVNLAEELQYRGNLVASVLGTMFWLAMALLTLAIFFSQTDELGGWEFWEVVVLLGVFNALAGVVETLLRPSIGRLVEYVRTGSLDLILAKPTDPQFYVSFRRLNVWRLTDLVVGLGIAAFALTRLETTPSAPRIAAFLVALASAAIVVYAVWLTLMSLSFWFVNVENLSVLFDAVYEAARYPVSAYPGALRFLFVYLVPITWTTTVPASALTGRFGPAVAVAAAGAAALALLASRLIWRHALARYTSAGG
ncbi:MAG: ABC transporter permease [Gemmatimonadales bacterium]